MKPNTNLYPFWAPGNSGAAENFAEPFGMKSAQLAAIIQDSLRLRVPQETQYSNSNLAYRQQIAALVPLPQGPVHVQDPFTQSRSLLDYARQTLSTSRLDTPDSRGTAGTTDITGR
jgi:hypothetical protein